jgi:hypothetical protein
MKMNRRNCISAALAASILAESLAEAEQNSNLEEMQFPLIKKYGGVFPIDGLAEPPLTGMKVVFDVTTEAEPTQQGAGSCRPFSESGCCSGCFDEIAPCGGGCARQGTCLLHESEGLCRKEWW